MKKQEKELIFYWRSHDFKYVRLLVALAFTGGLSLIAFQLAPNFNKGFALNPEQKNVSKSQIVSHETLLQKAQNSDYLFQDPFDLHELFLQNGEGIAERSISKTLDLSKTAPQPYKANFKEVPYTPPALTQRNNIIPSYPVRDLTFNTVPVQRKAFTLLTHFSEDLPALSKEYLAPNFTLGENKTSLSFSVNVSPSGKVLSCLPHTPTPSSIKIARWIEALPFKKSPKVSKGTVRLELKVQQE